MTIDWVDIFHIFYQNGALQIPFMQRESKTATNGMQSGQTAHFRVN